ncbi:pyridoxamine 5'-phosphate oxidase family protein [Aurantiacibacter sp. MUD11]|uniref:pyridoxamine 5'-phosphate oxidase family protein n=1 Tax=Aurantiacibacter sp. MUD11 TaxID=3003265 RepID=UPI0022AB29F8|nr:pyridoxamine 5'-phosphate oxidase family protein [Aurantiacibacter sp. MUD11]WAT18717.1 pyridoxamine 5'-phosphate oxidase family protein [Aurantiacibacter sp. MUD11]
MEIGGKLLESFENVRDDVATRLLDGARNRRSAMHLGTVATSDADVRIMVLRAFDQDGWTLRFHTDARSPKCAAIGEGAPVGVLFYDREAKIQLRCRGTGRIHRDDPLVEQAWQSSTNFARRCYLGDGPGTVANGPSSGLPAEWEGREPSDDVLMPARENFAVLLVDLHEVDWFYLSNDGHRRAVLDLQSGEGRWITP